jgi:hypothetical protein
MDTTDRARQIRELQTIRQRYAVDIIAAGLFSDEEEWTDVAARLGAPKAQRAEAALEELLRDAPERVPDPNGQRETVAPVDIICDIYTEYLDAGFLVGVAVGMQLGPHAFDEYQVTKGVGSDVAKKGGHR